MKPHVTIASAPGRVCFAGEDIDWISGPSILCAINLRIQTTISMLPKNIGEIVLKSGAPLNIEYRVPLVKLGRYQNHIMDYAHAAVKLIQNIVTIIPPIEILIESKLPVSAGLSSSAAVSIATLAALNNFFGLGLSIFEICNLAYAVEKTELKTGAGQMDFYSCGVGGILYMDSSTVPPKTIKKYNLPKNLQIIIIDTLTPRRTKDVIHWKRVRLHQGDPLLIQYIKHTEVAIRKMRNLLMQQNINTPELGEIISCCHKYLKNYMCVSTDMLNVCIETALNNGALGAKLTGTGMGGCAFALTEKKMTERIIQSLSCLPVKTYVTNISNEGIVIH